jgi:exopolysaccharide biosynthesis protein
VNVIGQLIADGILYKEGKPDWGVLCVSESERVSIAPADCPPNTREAIAGREIIIQKGQPVAIAKPEKNSDRHKPYPRTVVATDRRGEKLWFILVDGRQPHYSQGLTLGEVTEILLKMGVDTALNLDGGGSTTLAIAEGKKTRLLNSPIDARIPMRERAIANHIGIYASPQTSHQKP